MEMFTEKSMQEKSMEPYAVFPSALSVSPW